MEQFRQDSIYSDKFRQDRKLDETNFLFPSEKKMELDTKRGRESREEFPYAEERWQARSSYFDVNNDYSMGSFFSFGNSIPRISIRFR